MFDAKKALESLLQLEPVFEGVCDFRDSTIIQVYDQAVETYIVNLIEEFIREKIVIDARISRVQQMQKKPGEDAAQISELLELLNLERQQVENLTESIQEIRNKYLTR